MRHTTTATSLVYFWNWGCRVTTLHPVQEGTVVFVDEDSRDHTWVPHYYDYLFFDDSNSTATTVTCIGGPATPQTFTLGPGEFRKVIWPEPRQITFRYTGFVTHLTGNVWYGIIFRDIFRQGRSVRTGPRGIQRRRRPHRQQRNACLRPKAARVRSPGVLRRTARASR